VDKSQKNTNSFRRDNQNVISCSKERQLTDGCQVMTIAHWTLCIMSYKWEEQKLWAMAMASREHEPVFMRAGTWKKKNNSPVCTPAWPVVIFIKSTFQFMRGGT